MRLATLALCTVSPLAMTACGDSLVGGDWLDDLLGTEEFPAEVAWELRWFQGQDQPLLVECGLREPHTGHTELGEIHFGVAEVPPPWVEEAPEASTFIEGEGFAYGMALMVLTEPGPHADADPEHVRTDLDDSRGTWGVAEEYLILIADGEPSALRHELLVEPDEGEIVTGVQLVGFLPEVPLGTGSFAGSIYPLEEEEQTWLWDVGMPTVHLEFLPDHLWEVFEGVALGGAERQPCPDEGA